MPRAHRYFLPNHIWHITHRCHQRAFLLKFARDRRRWRQWLFGAVQVELGSKARYREVVAEGQAYVLREPPTFYSAF